MLRHFSFQCCKDVNFHQVIRKLKLSRFHSVKLRTWTTLPCESERFISLCKGNLVTPQNKWFLSFLYVFFIDSQFALKLCESGFFFFFTLFWQMLNSKGEACKKLCKRHAIANFPFLLPFRIILISFKPLPSSQHKMFQLTEKPLFYLVGRHFSVICCHTWLFSGSSCVSS